MELQIRHSGETIANGFEMALSMSENVYTKDIYTVMSQWDLQLGHLYQASYRSEPWISTSDDTFFHKCDLDVSYEDHHGDHYSQRLKRAHSIVQSEAAMFTSRIPRSLDPSTAPPHPKPRNVRIYPGRKQKQHHCPA
ncbi:hypothetical protein RRG08_012972 [Elysia crispata]|uniref:Uncharacterized protein n=1 Tax=Elysia crispata TaxID=231223 RepID=A0AAE0ZZY5_9GAST|nr:hypothetical protein RRG08_012972 [Elysia crispata]